MATLKYMWFPNADHTQTEGHSLLTWAGAGKNDTIEVIKTPDPHGGPDIPRLPLVQEGSEPALRIYFKHIKNDSNSEESWWSAVVGCAFGAHQSEWQTQDFSDCTSIKIFARAYIDPTIKDEPLPSPIPLYFRFEDDHILQNKPLHPSTSWNKNPMLLTQWSRPEAFSLSDFSWQENAFWQTSPAVDKQKILQITFGMDSMMPSCEGYIEIHRIEIFSE